MLGAVKNLEPGESYKALSTALLVAVGSRAIQESKGIAQLLYRDERLVLKSHRVF